jgi:hypothetical protein
MALRDIVSRLGDHGIKSVAEGRWMARCPGHDDRQASLSVSRGTGGRALLHCHAGCEIEAIVSALGMELADLFPEEREKAAEETLPPDRWPITCSYTYENADGDPVFRVNRMTSPDSGNKTFRQQRYVNGDWVSGMDGVQRVLYRLPRLLEALASEPVLVSEGERDVDALTLLGFVATTNPGGAGKWLPEYTAALKGRTVVVLPDNDPPGEKHALLVAASIATAAASVKILHLPGLPPKGDASDWIGSGGTAEQLRAMIARLDAGASFMPSAQRLEGERIDRLALSRHMLSFGVSFLDDALGGIMRRDLILLGAKTGTGKTQLASNIAMANCQAGKQVHYFALEAEEREIERRIKFQLIATAYYQHAVSPRRIRFIDWYSGRLDSELAHFEPRATEELAKMLKNLHTYYRVDTFTSDDFARQLEAIREQTDLVILDHFHYVDSADENENRSHKRIVKQIRDSALRAERPVIVIGHVRKSGDQRYAPLVPTEEAFHGSSDIVKIATKAIMIAPDYETQTGDPSLWPTYMQIVKCRQDSSLSRYVARLTFHTRTDSYLEDYDLGRLVDGGKSFEFVDRKQWPTWKRDDQRSFA